MTRLRKGNAHKTVESQGYRLMRKGFMTVFDTCQVAFFGYPLVADGFTEILEGILDLHFIQESRLIASVSLNQLIAASLDSQSKLRVSECSGPRPVLACERRLQT